jgi:hypothetical protein
VAARIVRSFTAFLGTVLLGRASHEATELCAVLIEMARCADELAFSTTS